MSNDKLEKIGKWFLILIFFTPLIYVNGFYYPFIISKVLFFRILIQIVFSIYILLLISDYNKYKPKINLALVIVFLLFLFSLVSAIFGLDFYKSFWSSFERMEGVIGNIYIFLYLFLLIQFFKEKEDWQKAMKSIIVVGFLASVYAIIQKFNILPVFEAGINRATGTLGNAAFLAGYMLLCFGLGLYHYFTETNKRFKNFTLVATILFFITILVTSTRGAILGILVAFLWFLVLYIFMGDNKGLKQKFSVVLIIFIITSSMFFVFRDNFKSSNIEFVRRIASISLSDGTALNRLLVWKMAVSEFKNYPVLGVGLDNFDIVYNKHFNPKINEDWFDRTHNIYLDYLIQNGVIGLILYLSLFLYILVLLFKNRKEKPYLFFAISSLLVAYGAHNFFVFDVLSTYFLFIFIIALISFRNKNEEISQSKNINNFFQILILLILLISNIYVFYKLIYKPYDINKSLYTGYYYVLADTNLSYNEFKSALGQKYGIVEGSLQMASMNIILEEQGKHVDYAFKKKFRDLTEEKLKFAIESFPLDVRLKMHLAQLLLNSSPNEEQIREMEEYLYKAVELSPERPESYYLLFNLYLMQNQNERAVEIMDSLIEKIPWYSQAKLMVINSLVEVDPEKAEIYYQEGIEQGGADSHTIKEILEYLLNQERYEEAIPYYNKLIQFEPERYDYRIDLAKVYYLTNQIDSAIDQVNIINAYNPLLLENEAELINGLSAT